MVNIVHKFGGSSLSSKERYQAVADIIIANTALGDCVVVSAAGKTTDMLVKLWNSYQQNDKQAVSDIILLLDNHQRSLIKPLLSEGLAQSLLAQLVKELADISQQVNKSQVDEAELLAHGEIWSARLLSTFLTQLGLASNAVDARQLFTLADGQLLHSQNHQQCSQLISDDRVNIVTGFIAADRQQRTITFGRNGSDYSATLLARYCNAKQVSIWTDTQGVFSTDPRKVKKAIKYAKVCRQQANLLARLGNPVLHSKTLSPLADTDIKLVVRSSFDSKATPTEIIKQGYSKEKRFITTLENIDLLRVEQLKATEVPQLSQLIQHSLHHFIQNGESYLLVPALCTHQVVSELKERVNIIESNLNGCAVVAPSSDIALLNERTDKTLHNQNIITRFNHQDEHYILALTDQRLTSDILSILHDELINQGQEVALIVAGLGNVGTTFIAQLEHQLARLSTTFNIKLVGLVRSKQMLFNPSGINIPHWKAQWENEVTHYQQSELLTHISALEYDHKVLIDITASESFSMLYPDFAHLDCHLISANKYAGTAENDWYQTLRKTLNKRQLLWRYNTSVGAGLPINFALNDLQNSGDQITRIEGVFSGTLSWLCSQYDGSKAFSELVLEAQAIGFTEPDPREDLSGRDMQRKLLILARELGLALNLNDIELTPLMPAQLAQGSWQSFLDNKHLLDDFFATKAAEAKKKNQVVRYTAELNVQGTKVIARVGLVAVPATDTLANLKPGDNIFVINSRWYKDNALIIQGPGAGKEVTGAGIHSDLYWLILNLQK